MFKEKAWRQRVVVVANLRVPKYVKTSKVSLHRVRIVTNQTHCARAERQPAAGASRTHNLPREKDSADAIILNTVRTLPPSRKNRMRSSHVHLQRRLFLFFYDM